MWFFVISRPELQETESIKVLRFPWVKKSWWHRLFFEHFIAARLINKYQIDKVLSFQNVIIPHTNVPQILYVHQPLPFVEYKFSLKENKLFWIYQRIIGKKILNSIRSADKVVVQTEWMKNACIEKSGVASEKIEVVPPKVNIDIKNYFEPNNESLFNFFFPAGPIAYKNHRIIVSACKTLINRGDNNKFNVIFTLTGTEDRHSIELLSEVRKHNLPIHFVGNLSREKVYDQYTKSILLFPSYIETFGLPLLEARLHRTIILASDCPFSHEILDGYENAYYFNPFRADELANLMKAVMSNEISYKYTQNKKIKSNKLTSMLRI